MALKAEQVIAVRRDPKVWFQGWGHWKDDEKSKTLNRGPANVLQRRIFEHYRRCLEQRKPCRMAVLKYRRAGSSTASTAVLYTNALNFPGVELGVIGTDYGASHNMLNMIKTFGRNDTFPGWDGRALTEAEFEKVPWEESGVKEIATKITWPMGSTVKLYTAKSPTSARSAGLSGYLATEVGLWPVDGVTSGAETLTAMRNTLPKKGFHVAIEESTAHGAQGVHYDTCKSARWPEYADWWKQWESDWPGEVGTTQAERDLQFVFIFAAWFEDDRNFYPLSAEDEKHIRDTIDKEEWYEGEQELIDRYGQEGPRGMRLGGEVNATVWEQLNWRRVTIKATKGLENFKQEYPSNPLEAFRSTGAPVFCNEGLAALDKGASGIITEPGYFDEQRGGELLWRRTMEREAIYHLWEPPKDGCRYLVVIDPMTGQEIATSGRAERDRHSVQAWRDAYTDVHETFMVPKLVARLKPPNQWDIDPMCDAAARLARFYGDCIVVVEANGPGAAVIKRLRELGCNLYQQQIPDKVKQTLETRLGWMSSDGSRRDAVTHGQKAVREQLVDVPCPHMRAEMKTFIFDKTGKAIGSAGNKDDDVLGFCIAQATMHAATVYHERAKIPMRGRRRVERAVA